MSEILAHPNLLTVAEADRKLAVAHSLAQLDIVREAFANGQLQPHMQDLNVYHDFLRGRRFFGEIVAPKNSSEQSSGGFAVSFNSKYGFEKIGHEIDATGVDIVYKIGPEFAEYELGNIHHPRKTEYAIRRNATVTNSYCVEDLQKSLLPLNYTEVFVRLADFTYRYAHKRLINPIER